MDVMASSPPPAQNGHLSPPLPPPPNDMEGPDEEVERFAVDPTLRSPDTPLPERSLDLELDLSRTVYLDMVHPRPFVNSEFVRPTTDPSPAYPESNREAVVSALRKLQEKVRSLELERSAAEDNLKTLASETNRYRDFLAQEQDRDSRNPSPNVISQQTHKLENQLSSAETRCQLLEKQLEHMRRMVSSVERDRKETAVRSAVAEQDRLSALPPDVRSKLDRINQLERDHLRMTATQSVTESKIRELEDQLRQERTMRMMMRDVPPQPQPPPPAQTQRTAEPSTRLIQEESEPAVTTTRHKKEGKKKKKKKVVANKKNNHHHHQHNHQQHNHHHHHHHGDGMKHYRLNLADIPFVAGKSTAPSHSVGANVQRVLSLMKSHNMALCSSMYGDTDSSSNCSSPSHSPSPSASSSGTSLETDLAELLLQLQDEFGQLSCEHQDLVRQLAMAQSYQREELERELESLVERMDAKSKQISKVRRHQAQLEEMKKKLKKTSNGRKPVEVPARPHSAAGHTSEFRSCECPERGRQPTRKGFIVQQRPRSTHQVSLNVLKDMRKLQTTLRKDDLKWE